MPLNCIVVHITFIHLFISHFNNKYFFGFPKPVIIMASEEEILNLTAHREVLRSFSLSDTETSVEHNLSHACTHHNSLLH